MAITSVLRALAITVLGMIVGRDVAVEAFRTHQVTPGKVNLAARLAPPVYVPRGDTARRAVPTAGVAVFAGEAASLFNNMKVRWCRQVAHYSHPCTSLASLSLSLSLATNHILTPSFHLPKYPSIHRTTMPHAPTFRRV